MKVLFRCLLVLSFIPLACKKDKTIPTPDSIAQHSITAIAIDNSNTIWVGTDAGLYKSIDTVFSKVDIAISGAITSVYYEKGSSTLWIGTKSGLVKGNIGGSGLTISNIPSTSLSNPSIISAYIDLGSRKWFGTNSGFTFNYNNLWKKDSFRVNNLNKKFPMDIEQTSINSISSWDGDYYFATNTYGLYRATNFVDSIDAFSGATQWGSPYNGNAISDSMFVVFVDSKGRQWMGGTKGIQVHTGHDPKANNSFYFDLLPNLRIHAISEASNGDIWIGTEGGIAIFNGVSWIIKTDKLPNLFITALAFDKDGVAWIGTKKGITFMKN